MNLKKTSVSLFVAVFLVMIIAISGKAYAAGMTYYVSNTGSDSNSGTITAPFKNIQYAINKAVAGDTIIIRGGTYSEGLRVTSKTDLTIKNYDGETPLITGQGTTTTTLISVTYSKNIVISGLEIANLTVQYGRGIYIAYGSDNIEISNCKIHDINTTDPLSYSVNPLLVYGNSLDVISNIVIKNNEIYNCKTGWAEGLTLNGNVDGWSILNNKVHHIGNIGIDIAGHRGTGCTDPVLNQARNGVISGNEVYECNSPNGSGAATAIYVDGGKNVLIEKNKAYNSQYGISIGCEVKTDYYKTSYAATADNITVTNNLVYNNSKQGVLLGGYNATRTGSVTNTVFTNNSLFNNQTAASGLGDLQIGYVDKLTISNNIIYGTGGSLPIIYNHKVNPVTNLTMDNNTLYTTKGTSTVFKWKSTNYYGLAAWKKITGKDLVSQFAEPGYENATSANFNLKATSVAKDKGNAVFVKTGSTDFVGNSRLYGLGVDCGAYELQN